MIKSKEKLVLRNTGVPVVFILPIQLVCKCLLMSKHFPGHFIPIAEL